MEDSLKELVANPSKDDLNLLRRACALSEALITQLVGNRVRNEREREEGEIEELLEDL